ncbi:hypothetical protein OS242_13580 [Tumebacillus sp. DT12]|uniref:protein-glutamate methylesterase n=1 Tax=Tumebacillus lacus TaxID=2995335 RepID=A0ABT3X233_9BACL|nr:chemotaxis protein CheB [Tumebacillus lacus]MCX7570975.1 hypothetical protein [Tumebacillus lacus]
MEALEQYFEHVLPTTGAAFVVVQHLSPNHKSLMSELLARRTRMKINVAEHGMRIEPNQVYLIPPQNFMSINQGTLLLSPYVPDQGINLPIDAFLSSLAAERGREGTGCGRW